MASYSEARREAVRFARRYQQTYDICRRASPWRGSEDGGVSPPHFYVKQSTAPLHAGDIHVMSVHCDGRLEHPDAWKGAS